MYVVNPKVGFFYPNPHILHLAAKATWQLVRASKHCFAKVSKVNANLFFERFLFFMFSFSLQLAPSLIQNHGRSCPCHVSRTKSCHFWRWCLPFVDLKRFMSTIIEKKIWRALSYKMSVFLHCWISLKESKQQRRGIDIFKQTQWEKTIWKTKICHQKKGWKGVLQSEPIGVGVGGGGREGKRILRIIHKTLNTVKGLGFSVIDHVLESSWPKWF